MATTSDSNITHIHPRKALIIGNNSYTKNPLKNCVNDANDLTAALQVLKFEVKSGTDCTHQQMGCLIRAFRRSIQKQDLVLFYFAGHGVQYNGQNYLLPADAEDEIQEDKDIETTSVNAQNALDQLASATSYITIFILDCCRTYKLPSNGALRGGEDPNPGLHPMIPPGGTLLLFASAPGTTAKDGLAGDKNGLYTKHLLKHIRTPNKDLEKMFNAVTAGVRMESEDRQIPHRLSTITIDENIYLETIDAAQIHITGNTLHFLQNQ